MDIKSEEELLKFERKDVENNLIFLGFVIMENKIKKETKPNIVEL